MESIASKGAQATLSVDFEKRYAGGAEIQARFELVSNPPSTTVLFGPSGAGKTTILRCIAGLETIDSGRIVYGTEVWSEPSTGRWVPPQRRGIGYLFQEFALFPHLTVRGNVGFALGSLGSRIRDERVETICAQLGLDKLMEQRPRELSGGQQQRVALARVLAREPRLLLLDEPFAALDEATREHVRSYLQDLLRRLEIPALLVTHDWVDALVLGDDMMVIDDGELLQRGKPVEVLTRPARREVASAVGVETVVEGRILTREAGVATVSVGPSRLFGLDPGGSETAVWVCIRGEDVTLEEGPAQKSSARNHLECRVREVIPQGTLTKVLLDAGFGLVALVTRQAAEDLAVSPGSRLRAAFKASNVHLICRAST
jgi:molybdate transport system ATP-binding protein